MKRILVLMTVVALMMAMMAMSVAPAFAARPQYLCTGTNFSVVVTKQEASQLQEDIPGTTCVQLERRR